MADHKENLCFECGNPSINGLDCWGQLGQLIVWEWEDPELLAEHFLTVSSYNLQHPAQFTDEAIHALRDAYIDYLDKGVSISEIRRHISNTAEGSVKVLKPVHERDVVFRSWSETIGSVYIPDKPQGAVVRVREWAKSIRNELTLEE
jgi:hypothetical protein